MWTDSTCQIEKPQALTGTPPGAMNFQGKNKSKYPRTQPGPDFTIGNPWDFGVLRFLLKRTLRNLLRIYFKILPPKSVFPVQLPIFGLADGTSGVHLWESPKTS